MDLTKGYSHSIIILTNYGKTEAKNIVWSYIIKQDGQELKRKDKQIAQHLYPEQEAGIAISDFRIKFTSEKMKIFKQAQELGGTIIISPSVLKPISLDIWFEYEDPDGKRMPSHQELYKYLLAGNQWVLPMQED